MPRSISSAHPLVLGSASPRRRDILGGLGIPLVVSPADVPEELVAGETALAYVERIVADKLRAVSDRARGGAGAGLIVADTIVVIDGDVLGKPRDVAEAEHMLGRLSGRAHRVHTRYALSSVEGEVLAARTVTSEVWLRKASPSELSGYARTGEGLDKAGAYAIQGVGAFLVERIQGSYSNVVGLPACEVVLDLVEVGLLPTFP